MVIVRVLVMAHGRADVIDARPVAVRRDGLGRGQDEAAGLDSLGADQVVGQVADLPSGTAEQDHFQAAFLVEMDVGRGDDAVEMMVLQVGQPARRSGRRDGRRSR